MKAIVLTTINKPTEAIRKFIKIAHKQDWLFYIVGDLKTPHEEYKNLEDERVIYISPEYQEKNYPELDKLIGWNCIMRRNFGFIEAYKAGADVIATVDDDNIPMSEWGANYVNQNVLAYSYKSDRDVFDPLSVTEYKELWHRGYPLELIHKKDKPIHSYQRYKKPDKKKNKVLVQADLWNGSPDVDAICRITHNPNVNFDVFNYYPYASNKMGPFNSQNTFLSRKVFPTYFLFPHIGRFDDIWASYITQYYFPHSVIYGPPTVYQKRNEHDLVKDLEQEIFGYKWTYKLIKDLANWQKYLPERSLKAYEAYKREFV